MPVPSWCKQLLDAWLRHSGVSQGKVFRRVSKEGRRQDAGVTANVVWYAVKRRARQAGIANLAPHDLCRYAESRIMPNVFEKVRLALTCGIGLIDRIRHNPEAVKGLSERRGGHRQVCSNPLWLESGWSWTGSFPLWLGPRPDRSE